MEQYMQSLTVTNWKSLSTQWLIFNLGLKISFCLINVFEEAKPVVTDLLHSTIKCYTVKSKSTSLGWFHVASSAFDPQLLCPWVSTPTAGISRQFVVSVRCSGEFSPIGGGEGGSGSERGLDSIGSEHIADRTGQMKQDRDNVSNAYKCDWPQ